MEADLEALVPVGGNARAAISGGVDVAAGALLATRAERAGECAAGHLGGRGADLDLPGSAGAGNEADQQKRCGNPGAKSHAPLYRAVQSWGCDTTSTSYRLRMSPVRYSIVATAIRYSISARTSSS